MNGWLEELRAGRPDAAWDLFIDRYRRLIFSAIRHYVKDPDDVMDAFAYVCEALHGNDLARLTRYAEPRAPGARFSTWLVTVVRNLTVDWLRRRDGRARRSVPAGLSALQERIFEHVFVRGASHDECFQQLRLSEVPPISSHEFAEALLGTYRIAEATGGPHGRVGRRAEVATVTEATPEQDSLSNAAARQIDSVLGTLDPADRLAIQLFVVDELAAADVARLVGWPNAKMVYNRVSRGLAALRRELKRRGIERDDL